MLETSELSAGCEGVPALRSVDFRVGPQERVAILGPNGAGKSTLLKTISGTVTPDVGSIPFDGQDLLALSPHQGVEAGIVQGAVGKRSSTAYETKAKSLCCKADFGERLICDTLLTRGRAVGDLELLLRWGRFGGGGRFGVLGGAVAA